MAISAASMIMFEETSAPPIPATSPNEVLIPSPNQRQNP